MKFLALGLSLFVCFAASAEDTPQRMLSLSYGGTTLLVSPNASGALISFSTTGPQPPSFRIQTETTTYTPELIAHPNSRGGVSGWIKLRGDENVVALFANGVNMGWHAK